MPSLEIWDALLKVACLILQARWVPNEDACNTQLHPQSEIKMLARRARQMQHGSFWGMRECRQRRMALLSTSSGLQGMGYHMDSLPSLLQNRGH